MLKKVLSGSFVVVLLRFGAAVANFACLPFLLQALGLVQFGLYALGSSIFIYLSALDFGFTDTATLKVADSLELRKTKLALMAMLKAILAYLLIACAVGSLTFLGGSTAVSLLGVPPALQSSLQGYFAAMTLSWGLQKTATVVAIPLDLAGSFALSQGLPALQVAVLPILSLLVVSATISLTGVGLAILVSSLILLLVMLLLCWIRLASLRNNLGVGDGEISRPPTPVGGRGFGAAVQINSLADLVNYSSDRLVVSVLLGVGAVSVYEVASRPALFVRLIALAPVAATFAAVVALGVASEAGKKLATRLGMLTSVVSFFLCGIVVMLANPLLLFWVGADLAGQAQTILVSLSIGYAVHACTGVYSAALRATGQYWLGAGYSSCAAALNIGLSIVLAEPLGVLGIALGTAIGVTLPSLVFLHLVRGSLSLARPPLWGVCVIGSGAAASVVVGRLLLAAFGSVSLLGIALAVLCYTLTFVVVASFVARADVAPLVSGFLRVKDRGP